MPTLRCTMCALNWPLDEDYELCPSCLEPTDRIGNVKAMPEDEALAMKIDYDFERFYEDWDEKHPPERLEPGETEARFDAVPSG
jgi:hypothetical protein